MEKPVILRPMDVVKSNLEVIQDYAFQILMSGHGSDWKTKSEILPVYMNRWSLL